MSWIDEAEKRKNSEEKNKENAERIQKLTVEENFNYFHSFIDDLDFLIKRVNNLSYEEKKPSLEIGSTEVEVHKCYEFYGSAYIYKKSLMALFTGKRYKVLCWRRINFKIDVHPNIVKVHINEKYSEKSKGIILTGGENKDKFKLRIDGFNKDLLNKCIDWLTFKCSSHDFKTVLPFAPSSNSNGHH